MAYTNILKESILMNIQMNWQNIQHMDKRERKLLIKQVCKISPSNSKFILYGAKFHLAYLLHHSECYFNGKGWTTPVKEFQKLGWYDQSGNLNAAIIMGQTTV